MVKPVEPTGLALVDGLIASAPTIASYCAASAEYINSASVIGQAKSKAAQIRLSNALAVVTVADLERQGLDLSRAFADEREVGGGLRSVKADVSEMSVTDGLRLAVEIKPVHLAVGRAIWNRFGDVRTFAVNIHLKFPFAVVGGILTLPTTERIRSGVDTDWKSTTHLVSRAVGRFVRAGGRRTEGDASHLLEGIAVVAFDRETGAIEPALPPVGAVCVGRSSSPPWLMRTSRGLVRSDLYERVPSAVSECRRMCTRTHTRSRAHTTPRQQSTPGR